MWTKPGFEPGSSGVLSKFFKSRTPFFSRACTHTHISWRPPEALLERRTLDVPEENRTQVPPNSVRMLYPLSYLVRWIIGWMVFYNSLRLSSSHLTKYTMVCILTAQLTTVHRYQWRSTDLNGHLSIREPTLTCQKGSYLHVNIWPILEKKINIGRRKLHYIS